MGTGAVVGNLDVAQLTLYAFFVFFAALVWYIRKEDRREGYPLENDVTGEYSRDPWLFVPAPKTFHLAHGHGTATAPNGKRDTREFAVARVSPGSGSPIEPTGDPMLAGVGPGSWAERADVPDLTATGLPKIVPLRAAEGFTIAKEDTDPRGMPVIGCDGARAGTVSEVWVDRSEVLIRYLEVSLDDTPGIGKVLLPANFCVYKSGRGVRYVYVHAITASQFAGVPRVANPDQVTFLEEERVVAYYGGGQLYAVPSRQEPYL